MAPNLSTAVSTTDDDFDLEAFINELEVVEEESGCQVAGAGTTDTSSRYNSQQKKLVQSYVDQDHRLDVQDYEERISDMEGNFQYDHNNGNWYSDRKKRHSY